MARLIRRANLIKRCAQGVRCAHEDALDGVDLPSYRGLGRPISLVDGGKARKPPFLGQIRYPTASLRLVTPTIPASPLRNRIIELGSGTTWTVSVPGLKGVLDVYVPGAINAPKGNMKADPVFRKSSKTIWSPNTLLGWKYTAGMPTEEATQLVQELS